MWYARPPSTSAGTLLTPHTESPMGVRTVYSVVKPLPPAAVREALDEVIAALPGPPPRESKWSDYHYAPGSRELVAVSGADSLTLSDGAWQVARAIAVPRRLLAMELRVQEGNHWDFTLYRGEEVIADFSTPVGYWDNDPASPRPWKAGLPTACRAAAAGAHDYGGVAAIGFRPVLPVDPPSPPAFNHLPRFRRGLSACRRRITRRPVATAAADRPPTGLPGRHAARARPGPLP